MAKEVTVEQIEMLDEMVARARVAADIIATYDQERVDRLCQAVAAAVCDMKVWANLADEAVDETGLGDKVTKRNKRNKVKLILRDCLRQKSIGIIEELPEKGIVKYAKPVGVIATLVPTTFEWAESIDAARAEAPADIVHRAVYTSHCIIPPSSQHIQNPGRYSLLLTLLHIYNSFFSLMD